MNEENQDKTVSTRRMVWPEMIKYAIAILSLTGFSWFIIYLMGKTNDATELEWTRAVYLLSGVEAVAFAAAGFIFGREVNRQRAENAEERAAGAEAEKDDSIRKAIAFETRGLALASAIRAHACKSDSNSSRQQSFGVGPGGIANRNDINLLKDLADELFPKD